MNDPINLSRMRDPAFTKAVDEGVSRLKRLFRPSGNGKDT